MDQRAEQEIRGLREQLQDTERRLDDATSKLEKTEQSFNRLKLQQETTMTQVGALVLRSLEVSVAYIASGLQKSWKSVSCSKLIFFSFTRWWAGNH